MEKKKPRTLRRRHGNAVFPVLLPVMLLFVVLAGCAKLRDGRSVGSPGENWQTVILYGNEDADDLRILKDRLAHTVGEGAYRLKTDGTGIELALRPEALYNCYVDEYLEYFLTETNEYCLTYQSESDRDYTSYVFHTVASTSEIEGFGVEIERENPLTEWESGTEEESGAAEEAGAEVESGAAEKAGTAEEPETGGESPSEAELPVLSFGGTISGRVRFSFPEAVCEEIREHLDAGDSVYFMKYRTFPKYQTNNLSSEGWRLYADEKDETSFFCRYDDQDIEYGNEEALKYVLTHEHLKNPYNYILTDEIIWEENAGDTLREENAQDALREENAQDALREETAEDTIRGELQCNPEELEDNSCLLAIKLAGYRSRPTKGEVAEAEVFLRRRLDLMKSPYAMGTTEDGEICIRTAPDHLSSGIVNALLSDGGVRFSDSFSSISPGKASFRLGADGESLEVFLDGLTIQSFREKLNGASVQEETAEAAGKTDTIYLMAGTLPVARTDVSLPFSETHLVFKDFCFAGEKQVPGEMDWFAAFAEELCKNPDLPVSMSVHYFCIGKDGYNDTAGYGLDVPSVCQTEEWEAAVKKVWPDAEVRVNPAACDTLRVELNLPDDEQLVNNIFSKGREIYEAIPFEESWFRNLNIYPYQWEEEERAGLFFSKDTDDETGAGEVTFYSMLYNGRIEKYADDLAAAIEEDDWYAGFPVGAYNEQRWWR